MPTMKYHYSYRRFTYPIKGEWSPLRFRSQSPLGLVGLPIPAISRRQPVTPSLETSVRWGVWLGRHICYTLTQVS